MMPTSTTKILLLQPPAGEFPRMMKLKKNSFLVLQFHTGLKNLHMIGHVAIASENITEC